ncbi:hypothetical protein P153DRAFT_313563 [Dothidotthia symphoricarpi CBS 119687]|uniref:Uncharacterized protein n=1 Tax=Dothidotthia symphoricarpi CBS 119687 TaxID=1392245 RepID=A0A6A6AJ79_9PLEO|nr:uncharacterized protein P153DRAFT_313563 [Dothidotthia symphoricarpi CBS 119687]KAF2131158.1 hypothetical protein P153DRAFT_313563 [Dothidotthia symphoricarpi CBS 119687]
MSNREKQDSKIKDVVAGQQDDSVKIDQIAKIRGSFGPEDKSIYYPTIQKYVNEEVDLAEATHKLCDPIDKKISESRLDDVNFWDLWYSIIHSARRTTFHDTDKHVKVIDLVGAFKNHSIPGNEKYNYLYSSLTDFGMACREVLNDNPTASADEGSVSQIEIDAWANVNMFFARITLKDIQDLSLYAIWMMREALEEVKQDDERTTAAQKLDMSVPAAAMWIFGMGKALFHKEKDLTPSNSLEGNPARGGELWKGKGEFSKKRWALWKDRFAEIGKMKDVSERTSGLARDAVEVMERAETFELVTQDSDDEPEF